MKQKLTLLLIALITSLGAWATDGSVTITSSSAAWSENGTFSNTSGSNAGSWRSTNGIISVLCLNGEAAILNYETKSRLTNGKSFLIVANGDNHITGFSIKFKTYNEDGINRNGYITFHDDVSVSSNSSAEVTKSFSGLNAQVIKFTTGNNWVDIIDFSVSYAEGSDNTLCSTTPINTYNDQASAGWLKVLTPSDYVFYTMSSLRMNLRTDSNNFDVYLVVSDHIVGNGTTSGLSESDFTAISSNSSGTSSTDVTFNFTNPVTLRGGSYYYLYFATKTDDTYTLSLRGVKVKTNSNSLGVGSTVNATNIYGSSNTWSIPFTATLTPVTSNLKCRLKAKWPNTSTSAQHYTNYVFAKTDNLNKLYKNNKTELSAADMINAKMVWNVTYSGSGLKLQNVGTERYISKFSSDKSNGDAINLLTADNSTNAETLKIQEYNTQGQGYIALVSGNQLSVNNKISFLESFSSTNEYVGCHNNYDAGDAFIFERVKTVTFVDGEGEAFNVAANGGDAVSAIYVACDGSSASTLSLPSDNLYSLDSGETWLSNTDAAEIISAAGTSNISVIVAPAVSVTYNLIWDDPSTPIKTKASVNAPQGFSPSVTVPWSVPAYCSFSYDVETIESTTTEVNVTLNWNGPFDFSSDFASAKWYYLKLNNKYVYYQTESPNHLLFSAVRVEEPKALWAFFGNPYDGVKVANLYKGDGLFISNNAPATMNGSTYVVNKIGSNAYGFTLHDDAYYIADIDGSSVSSSNGAGASESSNATFKVEPYIVTYNLKFGGSTIATKTLDKVTGDSEDLFPSEWARDFCSYSYDPEEIGNSTTSVDVTMTWNGPFDISADYENAVWYYLAVNGKWGKNNSSGFSYTPDFASDIADVKGTDGGQWAFFGNPYDGFLLSLKEKFNNTFQVYLSSQLAAPAIGNATGSTEKWTVNRLSESTFTLNCGDKYIVDNSTTMGFKTTALEGSEGTFSVRSYYCQQALDNWTAYVGESTDKLFGVKPSSVTSVNSMIMSMPKMTEAQYTTYFTDLYNSFKSYIIFNWPENGYYRIKNNNSGDYIGYGKPEGLTGGQLEKTAGLVAITSSNVASDYSTVVRLTKVSAALNTGVYTISIQGLNVQGTPEAQAVYTASDSDPVQFKFVVDGTPGIVYIKDSNASGSGDATEGCLHEANWVETHTLNGIVPWTHGAASSKWVVEDAAGKEYDISLSTVGSKSYATFSAPFPVTIGDDARAYKIEELNSEKDRAIYSEIASKQIPAGAGILLISETAASSVTATVNGTNFDALASNILVGYNIAPTFSYPDETTNWNLVLGNSATTGIGFYKMSGTASPNKAYLPYPHTAGTSVKGFSLICADDVIDGISSVEDGQLSEDAVIYNLSGQRLNKMQKGINIINGNKVLVK